MDFYIKITKKFTKKLVINLLIDNIFIERRGFNSFLGGWCMLLYQNCPYTSSNQFTKEQKRGQELTVLIYMLWQLGWFVLEDEVSLRDPEDSIFLIATSSSNMRLALDFLAKELNFQYNIKSKWAKRLIDQASDVPSIFKVIKA